MSGAPTLVSTQEGLRAGGLSAPQLVSQYLQRARAGHALGAWITLDPDAALEQAANLDPAQRQHQPLWGIPVGIKDIIDVAGMPTTAGSRVLAGNLAVADAAVVARLRAAGAVILGKTATQEFAYGAVTPGTANPHDAWRIAGGSSGGSAAALAAAHCLGAMGTDTAGSIRIPAALCGVVGLKPRLGLLPMEGIIPLAPSFDVVGPMARTVEDVARLWEVLAHQTVALGGPGSCAALWLAVAPLEALPELEPDVAAAYIDALQVLARITRPPLRAHIPAFADFDQSRSRILMWEALQVQRSRGWWPEHARQYNEETRDYLSFAEQRLSTGVVEEARQECSALAAALNAFMEEVDVLITPTVPCVAPTLEEAARRTEGSPRRPIVMTLTRIPGAINAAGLAALSLPCGSSAGGLPIGLQLIGHDEATLLQLGRAYERATSP